MSSKPLRFSVLPWRCQKFDDECIIFSACGDIVGRCDRIENALLIVALANEYDARLSDDEDFKIKPEPAWRRVLIDLRDIFEDVGIILLFALCLMFALGVLLLGAYYAIH